MVLFPEGLKALKDVAKEVGLDLRGAYLNLDGGFDSIHNRKCIFNQRAGKRLKSIQVPAFQCCEQERSFFFERAVRMSLRRWMAST